MKKQSKKHCWAVKSLYEMMGDRRRAAAKAKKSRIQKMKQRPIVDLVLHVAKEKEESIVIPVVVEEKTEFQPTPMVIEKEESIAIPSVVVEKPQSPHADIMSDKIPLPVVVEKIQQPQITPDPKWAIENRDNELLKEIYGKMGSLDTEVDGNTRFYRKIQNRKDSFYGFEMVEMWNTIPKTFISNQNLFQIPTIFLMIRFKDDMTWMMNILKFILNNITYKLERIYIIITCEEYIPRPIAELCTDYEELLRDVRLIWCKKERIVQRFLF